MEEWIFPKSYGYWLSGLIDAKGSFIVYNDRGIKRRKFVLTAKEELRVLAIAKRALGIGSLNIKTFVWTISSERDCLVLEAFLTDFPLRSSKLETFESWGT